MSKYTTIEVWNEIYGDLLEFEDYAGRLVKKSACNNSNSKYYPTIDHVNPLSNGGKDRLSNIMIVHRLTNEEKGDKFPTWKTNGQTFQAKKCKNSDRDYTIEKIN